jgi:rhodanese-related sulfurtransferase
VQQGLIVSKVVLASLVLSGVAMAHQSNDKLVFEHLQDYMEVAPFADGVITAAQLKGLTPKPLIVDTRPAESYEKDHIAGAINIDWRFVLSEVKQLPKDRLIVLYCDTGILSSKAHFALRLVGYEQVKVLFNGYDGWKASTKK